MSAASVLVPVQSIHFIQVQVQGQGFVRGKQRWRPCGLALGARGSFGLITDEPYV